MAKFLICIVLVTLGAVGGSAQGVTIRQEEKGYRVQGARYEAMVEKDGCLTNLRVDGTEFFWSKPDFPRGAYFHQKGILRMPAVTQPAEDAIEAKGEESTARYEFTADGMAWTLTNLTPERMVLVITFDDLLGAAMNDKGEFEKVPAELPWRVSTWFRDKASVRITGSTRLWGPWSGNHQVWQVDLGPKETRKVAFEIDTATEAQKAEAVRVAQAPPPPPPTDPVGPMWDMARLSIPPKTFPAEGFEEEGVRALFYEGVPYRGKPTRVFAWVGLPKLEPGQKAPAMVLVHGGGGTAFASWVRLWTARGYAAISMDTCGCVPRGKYGAWERHEQGGPPGWGGWGQINKPREDQWTYHAVSAAILGHSLLRSLPEVDADRIGLTGISWGGYLTSILAGVDHRYQLAVPVYGCGFTNEHNFAGSVNGLGEEGAARWMRWWDPSVYLPAAPMPMLWVTGSNDFAYTFNALQKSYRLPKASRTLAIRLRMPHGHGAAGEAPKEIHVYADSVLKGGAPLAKITGQGREGNRVWATFESKHPIIKAELNVTKDLGNWTDRVWEALPAEMAGGKVTATLPEGVTVYYLNLFDDRDCCVSTEHEELQK